MPPGDGTSGEPAGPRGRLRAAAPVLCFMVILLLAGALRLYRIQEQSVWYDEYLSAAWLGEPSLGAFLHEQRAENWEMTPVYYSLEYMWARLFAGSIVAVRLLSVWFSLAAVSVLFAFGYRLFGLWGAVTAALCMAISPTQLFHAQGIRPYALLVLLGLVSAWALYELARTDKRRWWGVHIAANALLCWSHLMGALLVPAQALFILVSRRFSLRRAAAWFAAHLLIAATLAAWAAMIEVRPPPEAAEVNTAEVFYRVFNDKPIYLTDWASRRQFVAAKDPTGYLVRTLENARWLNFTLVRLLFLLAVLYALNSILWQARPALRGEDGWSRFLRGAGRIGTAAVLAWWWYWWPLPRLAVLAAVLLGMALGWRYWLPGEEQTSRGNGLNALQTLLFLTLWLLVPFLLLYVIDLIRPSGFQERYALYSKPALYLLAGGAVALMRSLPLRAIVTACLVVLYAHEAALACVIPMRPPYRAVAQALQREAGEADRILVHGWHWRRLLEFNMETPPAPVSHTQGYEDLLERTRQALEDGETLFAILAGGEDDMGRYEEWLEARHVDYTRRRFIGMHDIVLFTVGEL